MGIVLGVGGYFIVPELGYGIWLLTFFLIACEALEREMDSHEMQKHEFVHIQEFQTNYH